MKTQDVIDLALASGLYQDGDMFFSPTTGDADVHIADLEYFAKLVEDRTLSKQKAGYYQEGYEAGQHDMSTKPQNVDTSAKRVYASDISATSDKSGISDKADEQAEPWVSLTEKEIENISNQIERSDFFDCVIPFARAIEAALRSKNT